MSMLRETTVNCSKCGKPMTATVFESVNTNYAKDIAMQIMSGKLFNVTCPHCKAVFNLSYDMLYHDMRHGALVYVMYKNTPDYASNLAMIRAAVKPPYKTLRIVEDMNALKEKVTCLERNRDDRIIEFYKVLVVRYLLSECPDFSFRKAYYTALRGKELFYIYGTDGTVLSRKFSKKVYNYLSDWYYHSLDAIEFDGNYAIVDYDWAEKILF